MTLGRQLMDLMNRDYDRNDPKFLQEFQLNVLEIAKKNGMAKVDISLKENMVTSPETIGLSKDNHCLDGMEQGIKVLDTAYSTNNSLETNQTRTR